MAFGSKHGAFNGQRLPDFLNADVNGNTLGPGLYSSFTVMFLMLSGPFYWEYIRPKNQDDSYWVQNEIILKYVVINKFKSYLYENF